MHIKQLITEIDAAKKEEGIEFDFQEENLEIGGVK